MNTLLQGVIAGAAGTAALNVATYGDMALRGRGSSSMPAEVVRRVAERAGASALATPIDRAPGPIKHRQTALGALSGYAVGIGIGALYGALRPVTRFVPAACAGFALGVLAMAASDVPAGTLRATDLRTWGVTGWLSDAIPHVVYGMVTAAAFDMMTGENDG